MSIKQCILHYLSHGRKEYKGNIEDYLRKEYGSLGDCVSRRLRELTNESKIIKSMDERGKTMYEVVKSMQNLPVCLEHKTVISSPADNSLFPTAGRLNWTLH